VALRFFNVYGPRQDPKSEYAAAIPRFATAPGETINVGSGHSATLVELIQLLRQAVGPQAAGITIEHQAPRVGDLRASSADISKARALLGYEPRVQLAEGLAGVVDFFRASIKRAA
jgi:UDP-glucose 4-epimerase